MKFFSKLKIIEDRLRSSMHQDRLNKQNNLTKISCEYGLLSAMSYSDVIEDFASRKARKVNII